jgi:glutaredoxin 3
MPKIEIYTKFMCPYCARATALLKRKGAAFDEHDITLGGPDRAVMLERSGGRTTVPQIFIGGQHIGGSDDLVALEASGALDGLLSG